ncbi:Abortive infection bacteriophage resistance protein [Chitinophaga sp. CF118]|uniref:Abi family protein n=1 Tax=Chitinophaga sp. CF118 TaxID=1884367 RepID=UPI0008DFDF91|nr:Abi family protein [Chitinophaga sp. CF118]SFE17302.1 Abortive infection bacteriophage resistance protein [Chitinophaga sp. CF118]
MLTYQVPSITIPEQVELLKAKGLTVDSANDVERWLSHVSYSRLKNYADKFKNAQTGNFVPNSTFDQVIKLYLFDRDLKFVLFDAIETIEVAIKTLISNSMAHVHGTHWYMERQHFLPSFNFDDFLTSVEKDTLNSDEYAVKRYRQRYSEPHLPPCWMIFESLSFGTISKIFEHLSDRTIKLAICWKYNLPDNVFVNWLHCITQLRNRCAHHSCIVYRSMAKTIILPSRSKHRFLEEVGKIDLSSLYATLCCMQYLINKIQPGSNFKNKLLTLIDNNPDMDYQHMGFTENWRKEQIWT